MANHAKGIWIFITSVFILHSSMSNLSTLALSDLRRSLQPFSAAILARGRAQMVSASMKTSRHERQFKKKGPHLHSTHYHDRRKQAHRHNCRSKNSKDKNYKPNTNTGSNSILQVSSACGSANPTASTTATSGPNGHESFLNCGITGSGWVPPNVTMSMIKSCSLDHEPAHTTFAACHKFRPLFEKHGKKYGIPPIFLAAFAMQESSCRPDVIGDQGGAFGLMQITKDKCGNAPGGNCADPDYNVKMGARTFADGLAEAKGNVLKALGGYNGWVPGLTKQQALEAKEKGCCVCQQNLDYLHQFLNGWLQGIDPGVRQLGTMRNLDVCGPDAKR